MGIFYAVLSLVTGIGIFLVGIVMFSSCLEKTASKQTRALFKKISNNRAAGVGIGAGVTAIMQSSSATTVMVIGLVNAGIISLFQATAIIMGANIGTTITGLLVSLSTFKIKYFFMALAFVGAFTKIVTKKESVVKIAELLISFGILFVGLELMSAAFGQSDQLNSIFEKLFKAVSFPLLLILLGVIFTAIVQSSSAATAIFLTMIQQGFLSFTSGIYLILGANIGTCITAFLASITANTNSKRAALIHILFNTIGATMFLAIVWPLQSIIIPPYERLIPSPTWQLAIFHVIFNLSTTFILIWFIRPLNRLACFLIPEKSDDKDIMRVTFIDDRLLSTPAIAIEQTIKEINSMAEKARENVTTAFETLLEQDISSKDALLRDENQIDFLNRSLARYLVKISACTISYSDEKLIGGFHHVINDLERIGDHAINLLEETILMKTHNNKFSPAAMDELRSMYNKVMELFDVSLEVFNGRKASKLELVNKLEQEIDNMKTSLADAHIQRLTAGECTFESGEHYNATLTDLERIADHLTNVSFSIRSYTGSQTENPKSQDRKLRRSRAK